VLLSPANYGLAFQLAQRCLAASPDGPSRSSWARSTRVTARIRFTLLRSVVPSESPFQRGLVTHSSRPILSWLYASLKLSPPALRTSNPQLGLASSPNSPSVSTVSELTPRGCSSALSTPDSRLEDLSAPAPGEPAPRSANPALKPSPPHVVRTRRQRPVSRTHPKANSSGPGWAVSRRPPCFHDLFPVRPALSEESVSRFGACSDSLLSRAKHRPCS